MKKDFSKTSENHLIKIIKSLEPTNYFQKVGDWFGDVGLTISGWFGNLNVEEYLNNIDEYHKKVLDKNNTTVRQLKQIFSIVRNDDENYGQKIQAEIQNTLCSPLNKYIFELSEIVNPSNGLFNLYTINQRLSSISAILEENIKKIINPSYINDDDEHYGGYQGSCLDRWVENKNSDRAMFRKIIKKYFPKYNDKKIRGLLDEMNNEGCNYMAWVNTIFGQYIGKEKKFEEVFGFSMYDENGFPNWDLVMLDFYCSQGEVDGKIYGLTKKTSEKRWENYLKSKDISCDVVNIDVNVDTFEELSLEGEIVVAISPLRLRDSEGNLVDTRNAGHAMVITEVVTIDDKKMYKVSSWGKDYYIDPNDFSKDMRIEYQQARYKS